MNILVLGSGGREHAFAWKLSQSSKCKNLYVAPGNAGTMEVATNVSISVNDFERIRDFVLEKDINLVVVGPEDPLVSGICDYFKADSKLQDIAIIGPGESGARLEGSKDFSKQFMQRHGIPTASYKTFDASQMDLALTYLKSQPCPIVLKANGLAAGKGVIICQNHEDAEKNLRNMLEGKQFGAASSKVVIEQFLEGIELSVFVLSDGKNYKILPEAKDYKRIGEGDTGPNTGGMGAISPVVFADDAFLKKVEEKIVQPTIEGLAKDNIPYSGFIFIGLMSMAGEPYVIEYNVRMGDPETEVVIPRIQSDLVDLLFATAEGRLNTTDLDIDSKTATTVMMVSEGYPGSYEKGKTINGVENVQNAVVFHAGTTLNDENKLVTNGGRVMAVTGLGDDIQEALNNSMEAVKAVEWDGMVYRKDIGQDLISFEK